MKRTSEIVPFSKVKSVSDSGLVDSPIRSRTKYKCIGTHSLVDTVGYGIVLVVRNSCLHLATGRTRDDIEKRIWQRRRRKRSERERRESDGKSRAGEK
ncbi:hypothetical protein TNCV_1993631 [Trichonephila clavipes]|nr:hypothetical protein TNCV_1993631 [Trichonephila clavipes]